MVRIRSAVLLLSALAGLARAAPLAHRTTETIVMVRHGEKPGLGLGQLSCQGLNRALALGPVLQRNFGKPDIIFAPDPAVRKEDHGTAYDYLRPLATIEPAAIAWGMPVRAGIGVFDIAALQAALDDSALAGAHVLVAWEHAQIVVLARQLLASHGGTTEVPNWDARDFDSIFVIRIVREGGSVHSDLTRQREGLDGMPTTCPGIG